MPSCGLRPWDRRPRQPPTMDPKWGDGIAVSTAVPWSPYLPETWHLEARANVVPTAWMEAQHLSFGPWAVVGPRHTQAAPVGSMWGQSPRRWPAHDSSFIPQVRKPGVYLSPLPSLPGHSLQECRFPPRDRLLGVALPASSSASLEARPVMQEFLTQPEIAQPGLPRKQMGETDNRASDTPRGREACGGGPPPPQGSTSCGRGTRARGGSPLGRAVPDLSSDCQPPQRKSQGASPAPGASVSEIVVGSSN